MGIVSSQLPTTFSWDPNLLQKTKSKLQSGIKIFKILFYFIFNFFYFFIFIFLLGDSTLQPALNALIAAANVSLKAGSY